MLNLFRYRALSRTFALLLTPKPFHLFSTQKYSSYKDVPIEKNDIKRNFVKSSGPGGQNVNKTNSKA